MNQHYLAPNLVRAVTLHIVKNHIKDPVVPPPLMLGIQGPPGEGKTFQCEKILENLDVETSLISGGQLESYQAGKPAELIRTTYARAGAKSSKSSSLGQPGKASALLLNDVDTGIGDWGDLVQYTVNRQTVIGELMHLADYPTRINGNKVERVPIILTGNNFTRLYGPLTRFGRMQVFTWKPSLEEKVHISERLFPFLDLTEVRELVFSLNEEFLRLGSGNDLPVSFFAILLGRSQDEILWKTLAKHDAAAVLKNILSGVEPSIESLLTLEDLIQQGNAIIRESAMEDFIASKTNKRRVNRWPLQ